MPEILADIGEFGLIHRIDRLLKAEGIQRSEVTKGLGDDCAAFRPHEGFELVVTCDCLVEGRHFLKKHIGPQDLGRRAMVLNISDVGAMGGRTLYALVSLGLQADISVAYVEELYRGFLVELNPLGACIIGGNLTKTTDATFIDITLMGEIEPGKMVTRAKARVGDAILVTGYPGQAAAGLKLLLAGEPGEDLYHHPLVRAYNVPSHRGCEGQAIASAGLATAMIDTSDGFLGDLGHICEESRVGAELFQKKLPISEHLRRAAQSLGLDPCDLFLQESDDYELIVTCPPDVVERVHSVVASVSDTPVTELGRITDAIGSIKLIAPDGGQTEMRQRGWDHFRS